MDIILRPVSTGDAPECGRVLYEAFKSLADHHRFPPDFPTAEIAAGMLGSSSHTQDGMAWLRTAAANSSAATLWTNVRSCRALARFRSIRQHKIAAPAGASCKMYWIAQPHAARRV